MEINTINQIHTKYIRSSRTIEIISIQNAGRDEIAYLYNYEGNYFYLFFELIELIKYFNDEESHYLYFEDESELDEYLLSFKA